MRLYNIIYADPPWQYRVYDKSDAAHGAATSHYDTMSLEAIKALPVQELAAKDAALFLWATMPCLPEALEVMRAWGFKYKTAGFTWVKTRNGKPFFGLGHYTRGNPELCLLGIRGRMQRLDAAVQQLIISEMREHSRKPDEARTRIVRLFGDLPRIELFARQATPGWDVWGNEVESSIRLEAIS